MSRKDNGERANLGEQADLSRTDVERQDRTAGSGAEGDKTAGNEGIDQPQRIGRSPETPRERPSEESGRASADAVARVARHTRRGPGR